MRYKVSHTLFLLTAAFIAIPLLVGSVAHAQVTGNTDVNISKKANYESECAIAKNPTNKLQLFSLCNLQPDPGLMAARSTDGGVTWIYPDPADKTIADGDAGQGPAACCDPTLAWDTFGNLFITYLDVGVNNIETIISTDGGATFSNLATFGPASVDQPTVTVANTTSGVAVWIVWNQGNQMVARGAAVTGLGTANVGAFNALQTIPGTTGCSFGDIAIAPSGAVVQACQNPTGGEGPATIFVNTDPDGLGANPFGAAVAATTTNVGGFDFIPAQSSRSVDAEAGLAFDNNAASPHFGRLYLVYTEEVVDESNNMDILMRWSDDNGATWPGGPITINDDGTTRSQFLPRIAINSDSGNIAVCWHDARNSATNTAMQEFCAIAKRTDFPTFIGGNAQVGDGSSTASGNLNEFGDYSGLTYFKGVAHPIWGDTSNSGGLNPDGTGNFDAYTDRVTGGAAAMEGDPHITTVDGIHYDFQGGGEYTSLRDADGLEIQTRQTPIVTTFTPGANAYTGLATCVSLNSAVAARVGTHRVTFQPNLSGVPDPNGLQLRVDGNLTTLGPNGLNFGDGGRVASTAGGGIEIDFPNGTVLLVTPGFWSSQGKWYLNVNVSRTPATEGIMGALAPGSWLPALPNGTSLGPKPAPLHQRYVDLYEKFGNAWRVTDATSLFDYAPGTSTKTFTFRDWPRENGQCVIPDQTPVEKPAELQVAEEACRRVVDKDRRADCIFDVRFTADPGFAKTYMLTQQIEMGRTWITIRSVYNPTKYGKPATFIATVLGKGPRGERVATGSVQFTVDGARVGNPVRLDSTGRAMWRTNSLKVGSHRVSATYIPDRRGGFVASSSPDIVHDVRGGK